MFAPSRTPPAVLAKLQQETRQALENPTVREKLTKLGIDAMNLSAAAFAQLVREEISLNTKIASDVGLKIN
jgi:tripartite-type tricarboxylate transporter receptor subunit TctC